MGQGGVRASALPPGFCQAFPEPATRLTIAKRLLNYILERHVIGRAYKKGEFAILRPLIEKCFGALPGWAEEQLTSRSARDLMKVGLRVLDAC